MSSDPQPAASERASEQTPGQASGQAPAQQGHVLPTPWHGPPTTSATITARTGGVCAVSGIRAAGVTAGLKRSGRRDLALVEAGRPVTAAGVQTRNQVQAAPVTVTARHLEAGYAQAVLLNSGSANACTGPDGLRLAERSAASTAEALGCRPEEVLLASTGVIGVAIPRQPLLDGIPMVVAELGDRGGSDAAEAIRTTDTFAKEAGVDVADESGRCAVGGMAKGSGMIAPGMATMLCVVTTDASLSAEEAQEILSTAVARTFDRITVDGCMSTNDAVLLLATGDAAGPPDPAAVADGITAVCGDLAEQIVRDGEGASRFVRLTVSGAADEASAATVARAVADSVLVRTAIAGGDPNWGRILGAVGASGVPIDPDRIAVAFGDVTVCRHGVSAPFDLVAASAALSGPDVDLRVDLGGGTHTATVLTCDLTHDYVTINAEYTT